MREVRGQTIFISGGASGIGLGVARAFAGQGANVAIADINPETAAAAAEEMRAKGVKSVAVRLDATDFDSWTAAAAEAEKAIGPITLVHSNAGVGGAPPKTPEGRLMENITLPDWAWIMALNVNGHFYALKTFLPRFKARTEPTHVIITASMAGLTPQSEYVPGPYVVTKYASVGLAEHMRMELAHTPQVGFSVLCPGIVSTSISRNSARLAPGGARPAPDANTEMVAMGMSADKVGLFVLKGVQEGRHYILPHPEYKELTERYHRDVIAAFGASADPDHADQVPYPPWMGLT